MIDLYSDPMEQREKKWQAFRERQLGFTPQEEQREHFYIEAAQYYSISTEKMTYIGQDGVSATHYILPLTTRTAANFPHRKYTFDFGSVEHDPDGSLLEIVLGIDYSCTAYRYNDVRYKSIEPDIAIVVEG